MIVNPSGSPQNLPKNANVVLGDGWAALAATAYLLKADQDVCWIAGTGARLTPPLPSLEAGEGASAWAELTRMYGIETGTEQPGSFLREFRNKAFREPAWARTPDAESRRDVQKESLWAAEKFLVGSAEVRFETMTAAEIEEALRAAVLAHPRLHRIEGVPVESLAAESGRVNTIVLASGVRIASANVIFADSWDDLPRIIGSSGGSSGGAVASEGASTNTGLPPAKAFTFTRKRESMGALQATFRHSRQIGSESPIREGFFNSLHRDTGEDFDRHVLGHFSSDGLSSHWTLCLAETEVEDNHEIAKRLRRMKNALEKMFSGDPWTSPESPSFLATVESEQVRFAEGVLFAAGEPPADPLSIPAASSLIFLTDGYGPSHAFALARKAAREIAPGLNTELTAQGSETKAVDVDLEPGLEPV